MRRCLLLLAALPLLSWTLACGGGGSNPSQAPVAEVYRVFAKDGQPFSVGYAPNLPPLVLPQAQTATHDLFLSGEAHGIAWNYPVSFQLFQALHQQAGVRCLLMECGPSMAWMGSRYLEDGNEQWLAWMMNSLQGTASCTREHQEHWRQLRRFQESLPPLERFQVVGLDVEHQRDVTVFALGRLLADVPRTALEDRLAELGRLAEQSRFLRASQTAEYRSQVDEALLQFSEQIQTQGQAGRARHGTQAGLLAAIAEQAAQGVRYSRTKDWELRETAILAAYKRTWQTQPPAGRRAYGQFGSFHTFTQATTQSGVASFASRLQQEPDSPVRGRVHHTLLLYPGGTYLFNNSVHPVPTEDTPGLAQLMGAQSQAGMYFDLMAEGSPFRTRVDFWRPGLLTGHQATDSVQGLIVLRSAPACSPHPTESGP